jgi:hypothetical protein
VDVLQHDHERELGRVSLQERGDAVEDVEARVWVVDVGGRDVLAAEPPSERRHEPHDRIGVACQLRPERRRVAGPGVFAERAYPRPERRRA